MLRPLGLAAILLATLLCAVPLTSAQAWRLPPSEPNTRFFYDYIPLGLPANTPTPPRPKLSLYGFEGHPDGHALGVKQVLGKTFGVGGYAVDTDTRRLFTRLVQIAGTDVTEHYEIGRCASEECEIEMNGEHLEAQAFVALMAHVISLNDGDRAGEPTLFTPVVLDQLSFPRSRCSVPGCDGLRWPPPPDELWDRLSTAAPARRRPSAGPSSAAKRP